MTTSLMKISNWKKMKAKMRSRKRKRKRMKKRIRMGRLKGHSKARMLIKMTIRFPFNLLMMPKISRVKRNRSLFQMQTKANQVLTLL